MNESEKVTELATLIPDGVVQLSMERITVRPYGFMEGMQMDVICGPLITALQALFVDRDENSEFSMAELSAVLGRHRDMVSEMIAASVDRPLEWVLSLDDSDGQLLLLTWWAVNKDFFVRRLVQKLAAQQVRAGGQVGEESDGEKSSPG